MSEVPATQLPVPWGRLGEIPLHTPETEIGSGASGVVYRWNRDRNLLAVKRIRRVKMCYTDIVRETNIVSHLAHKHIIQCCGVHYDDNYVYIVTEYAEGGSLSDAMVVRRLDWESKKRIIAEVALGLAYLHSQDIIHRDIKGGNILLTKYDEVKLCDFGLAKIIASATCATCPSTNMPKGTPRFTAPELLSAKPKYSAKSDIFALGVVMQDLMDGDAPLDYTAIMTRCLNKDPEERPTLTEIVDAFHAVPQVQNMAAEGDQDEADQEPLAREQYELGVKFYHGDGVDVNYAEAAERFRKAASMGYSKAQHVLGRMYQNGDSILRDYTKAKEWLQKAVDQGYAPSQNSLGISYRDGGEGVPQDYRRALELFQAAAEQGYSRAYANLGEMYLQGLGVAQNNEEAIRCYCEAAERGLATAQVKMGLFYARGVGVEKDHMKAARLMLMAAAQGEAEAMFRLGNMYLIGLGVPRDSLNAMEWWYKAAQAGHMEAQCFVGKMYIKGRGVRKNESKGIMWLKMAAVQGHEEAQYRLGVLRIDMIK
ncbi:hypothetical protein BGX27_010983 [Mortierella sp. AM989]|nr:hypothetical protein BGX27_010983 [Mortierella sp. AM989]